MIPDWPFQYHWISIDGSTRGRIPYDSLSKIGPPLFPGGTEAIKIFLGLWDSEEYEHMIEHTIDCRIELLVPDYRARIKNLRLVGNRVTIEVETLESDSKNVLAKFYCKGKKGSYSSGDLPIHDERVDFEIPEEPFLVEAHILQLWMANVLIEESLTIDIPQEKKE